MRNSFMNCKLVYWKDKHPNAISNTNIHFITLHFQAAGAVEENSDSVLQ